ncbi:MAG: serine/threonine-protein kinase [Thermomicrobiales bacterium]
MAVDQYGNPQPAPLLGRYQIDQVIAQSGLGVRYRAFDPQLNRPIAVETLDPRYLGDPAAMHGIEKRFNREIEAGARVGNHPHLVQVYDLLHDERHLPYLLLEYVPGGSVADRLAYGPLPVPDALRIAADTARGLEAAQSVGLVHRDIAPAHVYLMTDGRAKVGDFGNAQIDDLASETVTDVDTPIASLYTSPEQQGTSEYVPAASDQYSLGLVLFEMLTGTPYKRMNAQDARAWLGQWPAIAPIIERLTADHPANRYASMRDVVIAIENIAAAAPPPEPVQYWQPQPAPLTVASAPPKRTHRRAVLFGLGGLVVAGAAGGGGYYLYEHRSGSDTPSATPIPPTSVAAIIPTAPAIPPTVATTPRPSPTPAPTATAPPLPTFSPKAVAADMTDANQWNTINVSDSMRTLANGTYTVRVLKTSDQKGHMSWGDWVPKSGTLTPEFTAEVEMRLLGDPRGASGGILFLFNAIPESDKQQFLTFLLRADGFVRLTQQFPDGVGNKVKFDWAPAPATNTAPDAFNLLRITVQAGKLSCTVNGREVTQLPVPAELAKFSGFALVANVLSESAQPEASAVFRNLRYDSAAT